MYEQLLPSNVSGPALPPDEASRRSFEDPFMTFVNSDRGGPTIFRDSIFRPVGDVGPTAVSKIQMANSFKMNLGDLDAHEALAAEYPRQPAGPLVGELKNISSLIEEYAEVDQRCTEKWQDLQQKYSHYRRIEPDGNCGWRALGFAYFESLVKQGGKVRIDEERSRILSLANMLITVGGLQKWLFEDMLQETTDLLKDLANITLSSPDQATDLLLTRFNDPERSKSVIYYFRLLASSWLKRHSCLYKQFIPNDLDVERYCKEYLEPPDAKIDHLGVILLIDILIKGAGFSAEIVYLDPSESTKVRTQTFQAESESRSRQDAIAPVVHLSFRAGHYEILYKKPTQLALLAVNSSLPSHVKVYRASTLNPSQPIGRTTMSSLSAFSNIDLSALLWTPGFGFAPKLAHSDKVFHDPFVAVQLEQSIKGQTTELPRRQELCDSKPHTSSFRPSKYEWASEAELQEGHVPFQTSTFKNFRYNIAHGNNPNFPPEAPHKKQSTDAEVESELEREESAYCCSESEFSSAVGAETPQSNSDSDLSKNNMIQGCTEEELKSLPARARSNLILSVLKPAKEALVDRLMTEFWTIFDGHFASVQSNIRNHTNTPTSSSTAITKPTLVQVETGSGNQNKRRRNDEDEKPPNDEEKGGSKRCSNVSGSYGLQESTKLACPYRKHDPQRYCIGDWKVCALTGHNTISRVKEHLYRCHRVYQCQRCKESFKMEKELQNHSEALQACESKSMREAEGFEGITNRVEKLLHNRKKAYRGQTEKERWEEIYRILFPNDDIPSPYFESIQENHYEHLTLDDYEAYVRRELPRSFRSVLEAAVDDEAGPLEERLKNRIMDMYQACQESVLDKYRSKQAANLNSDVANPCDSTLNTQGSFFEPRSCQEKKILDDLAIDSTHIRKEDGETSFSPLRTLTPIFYSCHFSDLSDLSEEVLANKISGTTEGLELYGEKQKRSYSPCVPSFPEDPKFDLSRRGSEDPMSRYIPKIITEEVNSPTSTGATELWNSDPAFTSATEDWMHNLWQPTIPNGLDQPTNNASFFREDERVEPFLGELGSSDIDHFLGIGAVSDTSTAT